MKKLYLPLLIIAFVFVWNVRPVDAIQLCLTDSDCNPAQICAPQAGSEAGVCSQSRASDGFGYNVDSPVSINSSIEAYAVNLTGIANQINNYFALKSDRVFERNDRADEMVYNVTKFMHLAGFYAEKPTADLPYGSKAEGAAIMLQNTFGVKPADGVFNAQTAAVVNNFANDFQLATQVLPENINNFYIYFPTSHNALSFDQNNSLFELHQLSPFGEFHGGGNETWACFGAGYAYHDNTNACKGTEWGYQL